jgi:hypothetical protein
MLLIVIALIVASTAYLIITDKTTPAERDEMLKEKDWF